MNEKGKQMDVKLQQLGQTLGLSSIDVVQAKRTTKNVVTTAVLTAVFLLLGHLLMPGGPVGLYYTGASIKDFQILFGGFF